MVRVRNLDSGRCLGAGETGTTLPPLCSSSSSCLTKQHRGPRLAPRQSLGFHSFGVLVGYEEVLVLASRIRCHGTEAEVIQTLDQRGLVLLLTDAVHVAVRRGGTDWTEVAGGLRVAVASCGVAGSVHAATVELVAGDRRRIEVGRREIGARVQITGQITTVAGRVEDVAMRELRVIRGRTVLEEVRARIRVLLASAGDYASRRQTAAARRSLRHW